MTETKQPNPQKNLPAILFIGVTLVIIAAIVGGMVLTGGPGYQRKLRMDEQRLTRLHSLSEAVQSYYETEKRLPQTTGKLQTWQQSHLHVSYEPYWEKDPDTGKPFEYRVLDGKRYEMCAIFDASNRKRAYENQVQHYYQYYDWRDKPHDAGRHCFTFEAKDPKK